MSNDSDEPFSAQINSTKKISSGPKSAVKVPLAARLAYRGFQVAWFIGCKFPRRLSNALFSVGMTGLRIWANAQGRKYAKKSQIKLGKSNQYGDLRRNYQLIAHSKGQAISDDQLHQQTVDGLLAYGRYWWETFTLERYPREKLASTVHLANDQDFLDIYAQGKGVIVALTHSGNWDHLGAWAHFNNLNIATVAERLQPIQLFDRFTAYRKNLGLEVFPLDTSAFGKLTNTIQAGGAVALLSDRDLTGSGLTVSLCGIQTSLPAGPAMLALKTGAPLIAMSVWHTHISGTEIGIGADYVPILHCGDMSSDSAKKLSTAEFKQLRYKQQIQEVTQAIADQFTTFLQERPTHWHMPRTYWPKVEQPPESKIDQLDTSLREGN